jgi:DNA-binding IclR family transcriptional regulator
MKSRDNAHVDNRSVTTLGAGKSGPPGAVKSTTRCEETGKATLKTATTITKVCRVMEQFRERQSFGLTDLARRTDLLPSDVHRILTSLRSFGYIEQDLETKKYQLGFSLVRLGLTVFRRNQLHEKAHPVLVRLSHQIAAATHLALLDARELKVFLVDQVEWPNDPMLEDHLGEPKRLHCTAVGKTIIASLNRDIALSALAKTGLTRCTRHTITDMPTLEVQLDEIRRLGYAVDREESRNGVCCLASPLRDHAGNVLGAISTAMPSAQFIEWDETQLGAHLKSAALRVKATLGSSQATWRVN